MTRVYVVALVLLAICARLPAADVTLNWGIPTRNVDKTPLTNLSGYKIYEGPTAEQMTNSVTLTNPALSSYIWPGLASGQHFFAMTSLTPVEEGKPSPSVTISVSDPPVCPTAPPVGSRTQTCTAPSVGSWTQTRGWIQAPEPVCWAPGEWVPTEAASGVCASPPALKTTGTYSYCVTGTASAPSMTSIGYVDAGLSCGPAMRTVGSVKFCQITKAQTDVVGWCPTDKTLAKGIWARSAP